MDWLKILLILGAGYALGNFSAGILISNRLAHIDIRDHGSKSTGATNIFRVLGAKASVLTLLGDALKSALAALIGLWLLGPIGSYIGGVAAILGHLWPVAYGFKGGKGVASALGVALVVNPAVALVMLAAALAMIFAIRVVSIASLCIMLVYSGYFLLFHWGDWPLCLYALLLTSLVFVAHRSNLRRIADGSEWKNRLDFSKAFRRKKRNLK
ncbi:MAG: glycerol-3-phosphate acyltransferase [Christensenellaceae bacterium]|jgi:glycerol-3-phosphate acyltransferase PlsY|nr:glycerol-3-phosphate acyltransferase [Christensenellaceae bacterium]